MNAAPAIEVLTGLCLTVKSSDGARPRAAPFDPSAATDVVEPVVP